VRKSYIFVTSEDYSSLVYGNHNSLRLDGVLIMTRMCFIQEEKPYGDEKECKFRALQ